MLLENPYPRPTAEDVCSMEGLLYYVHERESIRLGAKTEDPILLKYKFTNVRRKDDRVSQWIIKNVIEPFRDAPDLWFILLIVRLINWPPTLYKLLVEGVIPSHVEDFDATQFVRVIEVQKQLASKVYSGAYMIYPGRAGHTNKSQFLAKVVLADAADHAQPIRDAIASNTVEATVRELARCFGISTFIAGQATADLTYAPGPLVKATDLYTYAPLGPGSQRGLNYLLRRSPFAAWTQVEFNRTLMEIGERIFEDLDITGLTLHDAQNCMCEFSKYARTALGEGTPKTTYRPETEF